MPSPIRLEILANASQARREVNGFADSTERSTGRLRGIMSKAGKAAAIGLGAGLAAAAVAGTKFAQAAIEDEQSASRMAQTFRTAANATKGQISATEDWITKQGKAYGVADDDLRPALSRLVTATKDVGEAQKLTSLAMDVSAGSGKSLETVSTALMKAQNGQVSSLSRLGINVKDAEGKTISMAEATKRMSETFGGAAKANAETLGGRIERLKLMASEAGETLGAKMLPVLTTFAGWVLSQGVPAVMAIAGRVQEWASSMADRLAPVASQIASFVMGTLVPALVAFGGYIVGTVVPAVVNLYGKIAANLAPVLAVTVANVQKVIAKFREWQPTIAMVVTAVGKFIGKVLEISSAILGKVLPPLLKFTGSLTIGLVGAVIAVVGAIVKVVAKIIDFGGTVLDGARKVGEFAGKVKDKIGDVVGFFTDLPGKIRGALSGAGTMLVEIGKNIVRGLVSGLDTAKQWVIDKIQEIADVIPGWVKRRLGIASPSKVTTYLGRMAGLGLVVGLQSTTAKVREAGVRVAEKAVEAIQTRLDAAKGVRDSITSLRDQIAGALTGDLFGGRSDESGSALSKFRTQLEAARATAAKVREATAALIGKGVSSTFLKSLASSGNADLIIELGGASDAAALAKDYEAMLAVNAESGLAVAENVIGKRLDTLDERIVTLVEDLREERATLRAARAAERAQEKAEKAAQRAEDKVEREKDREEARKPKRLHLTAEQIDRIRRGRETQADLDAYFAAGGRSNA